jgi:hypothetical protein
VAAILSRDSLAAIRIPVGIVEATTDKDCGDEAISP